MSWRPGRLLQKTSPTSFACFWPTSCSGVKGDLSMQLSIPETYVADPGRVLSAEEIERIKSEITPICEIKDKVCKRESCNDFYSRYYPGRG
jgi:hypothetical protein